MELTVEKIQEIVTEARQAAHAAADKFFKEKLGGRDRWACGFAWLDLYEFEGKPIKGNTKVGKMLKKAGIEQAWNRAFQIWNPSGYPCQNVDTLEVGAAAAAEVFRKYGFTAYAGSRLD